MGNKADITKQFIVEISAPIFNRKGYSGASMSDITTATKLTKGAIYCHFKNKEDLALQAFMHNVKRTLSPLFQALSEADTSIDKLYALTKYYEDYYEFANQFGGCAILNVGVDANNTNPLLLAKVKSIANKLEKDLIHIIEEGIAKKEIRKSIDAKFYASVIYSMLEGCVFMAMIKKDGNYIDTMIDYINKMIKEEMSL